MKRLVALLSVLLCLVAPATALAYNPLDQACGANGGAGSPKSSSAACSATGADPITGPNGVLKKVTLIVATIAGIAAVIIIIIGGLEYITSGGDPQKAASARNTIMGAVIGLVIIVAAQSILLFVLSRIK